jgi:hypothetical protein
MSEYLWAEDPPPSGPASSEGHVDFSHIRTHARSWWSRPTLLGSQPTLAMQLGERAIPLETLDGVEDRYTSPFCWCSARPARRCPG